MPSNSSTAAPTQLLSQLIAEALWSLPLRTFVSEELLAQTLLAAAQKWAATPSANLAALHWVEENLNRALRSKQTVREAIAPLWDDVLHALLTRPYTPHQATVLQLIDQPAVRAIIRQILVTTLLDFSRRLRAPVAGVAKTFTNFARMAVDSAKGAGGLGAVVGAVTGEVERQVEKRIDEFVDHALSGILVQLTDVWTNPRRVHEAAALREEFAKSLLALRVDAAAREVANLDLHSVVDLIQVQLRKHLASSDAMHTASTVAATIIRPSLDHTLGEVLERLGILSVAKELAVAALQSVLESVAADGKFRFTIP